LISDPKYSKMNRTIFVCDTNCHNHFRYLSK